MDATTARRSTRVRHQNTVHSAIAAGGLALLLIVAAWAAIGPENIVFALVSTAAIFSATAFVGDALASAVPNALLHVAPGERTLHRVLGVDEFSRLLDRSGWNRAIGRGRGEVTSRSGLRELERSTRGNLAAHGTGFLIQCVLAAVVVVLGSMSGAAILFLGGVVLHGYPVLVQRSVRRRLLPLISRVESGC